MICAGNVLLAVVGISKGLLYASCLLFMLPLGSGLTQMTSSLVQRWQQLKAKQQDGSSSGSGSSSAGGGYGSSGGAGSGYGSSSGYGSGTAGAAAGAADGAGGKGLSLPR